MSKLSHIDETGAARMVDVGDKTVTSRTAVAEATVTMKEGTANLIKDNGLEKGDVLSTARIAGIMAAKRTSDLIPMCHPLPITSVKIDFSWQGDEKLIVTAKVRVKGQTGVEMEALTAASIASLTVYDMAKAVDKDMVIGDVRLLMKDGGKSGRYERAPSKDMSK